MITMDGHEINALKLIGADGTTITKALVETGGAAGVSDFWDAYHEVIHVPADITATEDTTIATLNSDEFNAWRLKLYNKPCFFLCTLTAKFDVTDPPLALVQFLSIRASSGNETSIGNINISGAIEMVNTNGTGTSIASNTQVVSFYFINAMTYMEIKARCVSGRMSVLKAGDYDVWLYRIGDLT